MSNSISDLHAHSRSLVSFHLSYWCSVDLKS